jgi:hypothetical protein
MSCTGERCFHNEINRAVMHRSGIRNIGLRGKDKIKVMHREKIFPKANMQRDIAAMHRNEIRHAEL